MQILGKLQNFVKYSKNFRWINGQSFGNCRNIVRKFEDSIGNENFLVKFWIEYENDLEEF